MDPNAQVQMIGLGEAAARLHIPYQDAHRLVFPSPKPPRVPPGRPGAHNGRHVDPLRAPPWAALEVRMGKRRGRKAPTTCPHV